MERSKKGERILLFIIASIVALASDTSTHVLCCANTPLVVGFSYIEGAAAKGAVCLDGSLPGYHFHPGYASGANNWLVHLEGGAWCNNIITNDDNYCDVRKNTELGSSTRMQKQINFTGILSNKAQENPDFFNWNRVRVRYCDGASFAGEGENKEKGLKFRGQRIFRAAMDDLMSKGMRHANQALLSGCSAGGVAVVLHCDEFNSLFPTTTRAKCLSDAGFFMDTIDISGGHSMRSRVQSLVSLQGVQKTLLRSCTSRLDPVSCFLPEYLINFVRTPMFILNAAYDTAQIQAGVAPKTVDPHGEWHDCKLNIMNCSTSQIHILHKFRNRMIKALEGFGGVRQNGMYIYSCFTHCQTESTDTWFSVNSPPFANKGMAIDVGEWYFERSSVNKIDPPHLCHGTCHNDVFTSTPY